MEVLKSAQGMAYKLRRKNLTFGSESNQSGFLNERSRPEDKSLTEISESSCNKHIHSLLGLTGYFRKHIQSFFLFIAIS